MFIKIYKRTIIKHPGFSIFFVFLAVAFFSFHSGKFKLDASADSLVLENDDALRYFRKIYNQYGTNDYLVLTYTPAADLFSKPVIDDLKKLSDELSALRGVDSIVSILNVPLLFSPKVTFSDLSNQVRTLLTPDVDFQLAKQEFKTNPIYSEQLVSPDGQTTAILINLPINHKLRDLLTERTNLREKEFNKTITADERSRLAVVSEEYRAYATHLTGEQNALVDEIRSTMELHRNTANLFLGGVPMIIADMISYVQSDIIIFSVGVFIFLILTLTIIFKQKRWVFLPMVCCFTAATTMIGLLGLMDWRVTVISSNFISLMLIFTMSLTIHLIVRYRELCTIYPDESQEFLVLETVRLKFMPCLYTVLTTIVAFVSLLVSSIRPVMDFGLMMTIGLIASFILTFLIFPAAAMLINREHIALQESKQAPFTSIFAVFTDKRGGLVLFISFLLIMLSAYGVTKLKVENRFIDYFSESTEIYQGMKLIDEKLGGTTPLDIIIDLPDEQVATSTSKAASTSDSSAGDLLDDDLLSADFGGDELLVDESNFSSERYWFTAYKLEKLERIHSFIEQLPETGKVSSIATLTKIATSLNNSIALDDYELSLMYDKIPQTIKDVLVTPYLSIANNQVRFATRIMESDINLSRQKLIEKIDLFLVDEMNYPADSIHFTNMVVLYNNMLQSLFKSQIMTIGVVFCGIMLMFMVLFRSLSIALIAILPNLLPAAMVLGAMGFFGIPLDMMTITIAAISIGIAVDDTIHYIHRFMKEFKKDRNYRATMHRCHASIGKAMYYTSLTIIIGFSILVLSKFIPTIYFGLFTGFAMLAALLAALTLLPQLIIVFKPLGPEAPTKSANAQN
nr:MMPL family transporter [Desulfobulbaceae bacterium]